jgi:7,8-dihydroneopterin aldolase/epimerase/oxygenase
VSGSILIRGLRVAARVGVGEPERSRPQTIVLDVDIHTDLRAAARSDSLDDTIDYSAAVDAVVAAIERGEARLLEHLAGRVISVLSRMDGVGDVTVQIAKQPPPVAHDVEAIVVRLERAGA